MTMTSETNETSTKKGLKGRLYEIFARRDSNDILQHIGSVDAPNDLLAEVKAQILLGDTAEWREMCMVPTDAVIPLIEKEQTVVVKEI